MLGSGVPPRFWRRGRIMDLPDELYRDLGRMAQERGLTPAGWIATTLSNESDAVAEQPLPDLLRGLIGAVDSSKEPRGGLASTPTVSRSPESSRDRDFEDHFRAPCDHMAVVHRSNVFSRRTPNEWRVKKPLEVHRAGRSVRSRFEGFRDETHDGADGEIQGHSDGTCRCFACCSC